eukprot:3862139-Pleurochrysis_carterae.AAC.4
MLADDPNHPRVCIVVQKWSYCAFESPARVSPARPAGLPRDREVRELPSRLVARADAHLIFVGLLRTDGFLRAGAAARLASRSALKGRPSLPVDSAHARVLWCCC